MSTIVSYYDKRTQKAKHPARGRGAYGFMRLVYAIISPLFVRLLVFLIRFFFV